MRLDTFIRLWKVRNLSSFPTSQICSSQSDFWGNNIRNGNLVKVAHNTYRVSDECKNFLETTEQHLKIKNET